MSGEVIIKLEAGWSKDDLIQRAADVILNSVGEQETIQRSIRKEVEERVARAIKDEVGAIAHDEIVAATRRVLDGEGVEDADFGRKREPISKVVDKLMNDRSYQYRKPNGNDGTLLEYLVKECVTEVVKELATAEIKKLTDELRGQLRAKLAEQFVAALTKGF